MQKVKIKTQIFVEQQVFSFVPFTFIKSLPLTAGCEFS